VSDQAELLVEEGAPVLTDIVDGVGRITLNRPRKMNCLTRELVTGIVTALEECEAEDSVRSIVLVGAGDNFCTGADIGEMLAAEGDIAGYMEDVFQFFCRVEDSPKPILTQVDGYCLGGGFELALACDVIIATDRAQFGLPETRFGMVPGFAIHRLAAMAGVATASNILFSRQLTPAAVAHSLGLLEIVVDAADLPHAVRSVTENLAQLDPHAVSIAKQALRAYRRHAANLSHSAWANEAMFKRSSTRTALQGFINGSNGRNGYNRLRGPLSDGRY
jgi:enoyl-CoA hydratase/carnithine racemase